MQIYRTIKYLAISLGAASLCACFGGSIAQQVLSSMLLKGADKATAIALDVDNPSQQANTQKASNQSLASDRYKIAFLNSGFTPLEMKVEPLPEPIVIEDTPIQKLQETQLVNVEIWSLLVGTEKQEVLEKAARLGMIGMPAQTEWSQWRVAIGASERHKQAITFLIPPDIGKVHSGGKAWVELATTGELNMARYTQP
jgi:hypothetical protein